MKAPGDATGQCEPTSSSRSRRAGQPTGRGLAPNNARIASIALFGIGPYPSETLAQRSISNEAFPIYCGHDWKYLYRRRRLDLRAVARNVLSEGPHTQAR